MSLEELKEWLSLTGYVYRKTRNYVCNGLVKENRMQMKNVKISARSSKADSSEQPEKRILIKGENELTQFIQANTLGFSLLVYFLAIRSSTR